MSVSLKLQIGLGELRPRPLLLPIYATRSLARLEDLILKQAGGDFFALDTAEPDDA